MYISGIAGADCFAKQAMVACAIFLRVPQIMTLINPESEQSPMMGINQIMSSTKQIPPTPLLSQQYNNNSS